MCGPLTCRPDQMDDRRKNAADDRSGQPASQSLRGGRRQDDDDVHDERNTDGERIDPRTMEGVSTSLPEPEETDDTVHEQREEDCSTAHDGDYLNLFLALQGLMGHGRRIVGGGRTSRSAPQQIAEHPGAELPRVVK